MLACRLVVLSFGLLVSLGIHAGEGFYAGAGADYSGLTYDFSAVDRVIESGDQINGEDGHANSSQAGGRVVAGYTWLLPTDNIYFLSAEAFADFFSVQAEESWPYKTPFSDARALSATLRNAYGLTIKPGIFITRNTSVFAQVGGVYSRLQDIVYDKGLLNSAPSVSRVQLPSQDMLAYRLGAGVQYLLTKNLTAELAWAMDFYGDFSETGVTAAGPEGPTAEVTADFTALRTNQVALTLHYYFGP